jgi:hypothetical protein
MALTAQLQALLVPNGTEFPGQVQGLLNLIAQYMEITGLEDFEGINFGPAEPSEDNRDKPWFQTDEAGNPIGWFSWNGSEWSPIPVTLPFGPTADRPVSPSTGAVYFDTDINVELIYERAAWRTASGSPGDVKEVKAASVAAALTQNPGWIADPDSIGKFIQGADDGTQGTTGGTTTVSLTVANLPAHHHDDVVLTGSNADNGDAGNLAITAATQNNGLQTILNSTTGDTGDGDSFEVIPPFICYIRLVKS